MKTTSANRSFFMALTTLPLILLSACGGTQGDNITEAIPVIQQETTTADAETETEVPVEPEPIHYNFHNSEEALEFMRTSGNWDRYSTGILPAMAEENLEYCTHLLENQKNGFIIVDKNTMYVIHYDKYGNIRNHYKMACAKNYGTKHKKADSRTPEGFFKAQGVYNSKDWLFTDDDGVTHPQKGSFGPKFIRLECPVTSQIGIHGTSSPGSLGKRVSHGCIRISNDNILELAKHVEKGMPIIVVPGSRDKAVNRNEGHFTASVTTGMEYVLNKPADVPNKDSGSGNTGNDTIAVPDTLSKEAAGNGTGSTEPEKPENAGEPEGGNTN